MRCKSAEGGHWLCKEVWDGASRVTSPYMCVGGMISGLCLVREEGILRADGRNG